MRQDTEPTERRRLADAEARDDHVRWLEGAGLHALGTLEGVERLRVRAHLAEGCPRCRDVHARTLEALRVLDPYAPPLDPPPELRARLLRAVAAQRRDTGDAIRTLATSRAIRSRAPSVWQVVNPDGEGT